jgi:hypothetical protein
MPILALVVLQVLVVMICLSIYIAFDNLELLQVPVYISYVSSGSPTEIFIPQVQQGFWVI